MPNKQAGKKALRQTKKHALANVKRVVAFKEALKAAVRATSLAEAKKLVSAAQKALDKAAKVGVIKRATAARKLSRLMKKVNAKK